MIQSLNALTISPGLASVTLTQPLQLHVATACVTDADVTWNAAGGTISSSGLYTPSATAGSYAITATLNANPNVTGQATVDVTDYSGTLTWRNDNSRSGINSHELALAPATVKSTFGKIFSCPSSADGPLDGYVYSQPLYVSNLKIGIETHNVVFVATEKDSVYAFDADANPCKELWKTRLIPPGSRAVETPNFQITSTDIVPFVGITGTPVIDLSMNTPTLYVVAATQTIANNPIYNVHLYALDVPTGQPEIQPAGVEIATPAGLAPGFSQELENQRAALLLDNRNVYIGFGSYGGQGDYHGWLFGYDSSTLQRTGVFNVTPDTFQGGIWQSGGGPSADSDHHVYVGTGDGAFNAAQGLNLHSYSNSFLRLGTAGGLSVSDYFTPCDQAVLQTLGLDVGASAPVLVLDSPSQPHLLIGGSKSGTLYVMNPDSMGGFQCPDLPQEVQIGGPIFSTPLFWNNAVYIAPGNSSKLMSFPISGGILASSPSASQSPETMGPQGATPVISSNGTNSAILWLIDTSGAQTWPTASGPAILRAYDPNNLSNEIYHSSTDAASHDTAGPAVKFTVPTVANGKVYVGTQTELDVYGLLQ